MLPISINHRLRRCGGFHQYYQINGGDQDNETDESESEGKDELTSESFHSIFGFIAFASEKLNKTEEEILSAPFAKITFMLSDLPRMSKKKKVKKFNSDDELAAWLGTTIER